MYMRAEAEAARDSVLVSCFKLQLALCLSLIDKQTYVVALNGQAATAKL